MREGAERAGRGEEADAAVGGRAPGAKATWRRRGRRIGAFVLVVGAASSPWWCRPVLAQMDFFRVRQVEVRGARYASPDEIVSRLGVDSTASVWDDAGPLEARVRRLPAVRDVRIERKLPGTLVVQVTENPPVAYVQSGGQLAAVDARGNTLRLDPTEVNVDLPVLRTRDTVALRVLGAVRASLPALYARIGDVRGGEAGGLVVQLNEPAGRVVLAPAGVTVERLFDVIPVEADLRRRNLAASEIDLRYKDQVVVRLP